MPVSRRDWGRAIGAELACAGSSPERARLAVAAVRIALLPPPGTLATTVACARAAGRAALLALAAFLPVGLALCLLTVAFPAAPVVVPAAAGFGYPLAVLLAAGARARRASPRAGAWAVAGLAAALVLAIGTVATTALIDTAFFSVVSRQPDTIAGFRASGMTSMRAYLNSELTSVALVVTVIAAIAGPVCGLLGATASSALAAARTAAPPHLVSPASRLRRPSDHPARRRSPER
jgi:hypothetical protein